MIISAVLLPTETASAELVNASAKLHESQASLIRLGPLALPHITVAQFTVSSEETAADLWAIVEEYASQPYVLRSGGISVIQSIQHAELWMELQFLPSQDLLRLHESLVHSNFAESHSVWGDVGEEFRPHCTLALMTGFKLPALDFSAYHDITRKVYDNLRLAVGVNGENFTFKRTLFEA